MTTTAAIFGILGVLVPFVIWLIKRRVERESDPLENHRERYAKIDKDILAKDSTAHASADLDELERLQKSRRGDPR